MELTDWEWERDGDAYVGRNTPEIVQWMRRSARELRDSAEALFAGEPDLLTVEKYGPITNVVMERAYDQFNVPRDEFLLLTERMALTVQKTIARDAAYSHIALLGSDEGVWLRDTDAKEQFLWFMGDEMVGWRTHAELATTDTDHERFTAYADWYSRNGHAIDELDPSGSAASTP